ncbi:unnamed protein product [Dovyalis caffra]|uniref:Uncharacterized protein n=1 Tax=Dovyalis caffra TaxID=77055 RepID=A0AAV1SPP4_9ROSI|nr:unnamed protein product [Dovyalis caffra]
MRQFDANLWFKLERPTAPQDQWYKNTQPMSPSTEEHRIHFTATGPGNQELA